MLVEKLHLFVIFNISFRNVLFISATNRVMYAYACGSSYGIADNAAGFLFVK